MLLFYYLNRDASLLFLIFSYLKNQYAYWLLIQIFVSIFKMVCLSLLIFDSLEDGERKEIFVSVCVLIAELAAVV